MSPKQTEDLFQKKPYLKLYFGKKDEKSSNQFTLRQVEQKQEFYVTFNEKLLASSFSPLVQGTRLFNEKKIKENSVVVLLGCGNPHLLKIINESLRHGQIVLVIDAHEELFQTLWKEFLFDVAKIPGRHIFFGEEKVSLLWNYLDSLPIEKLAGVVVFKNQASINLDKLFYDPIEEKIKKIFSSKMSDLLTKFEFERIWVKNSLVNVCNFNSQNSRRHKFKDLEKTFSAIPAVLVSAGPSLRKTCPLLQKIRDRIFLFSCDTSLKVLKKFDLIPDGVMTLDAQTHSFFHFMGEDMKDIPVFADLVASPQLLKDLNSPSIVHSVTSKYQVDASGTPFREITAGGESAEEIIGAIGDIQSGGSVATSAFDALRIMGFSPIFLIGQDLAYTGREIHSTGTHHNEKWLTLLSRKKSLEWINESIIRKRSTMPVKSISDGVVLTDYVLDLYRHWFEESAKNVSFPVYNIGEFGSSIENTIPIDEKKAEEIFQNFPCHGYPWRNLSVWKKSQKIESYDLQENKNNILQELNELQKTIFENETSEKGSSELLEELNEKLHKVKYLKQMIRKTEIYLIRHANQLDETKKKNLLTDSLKKEILFLKRGILGNCN